MSNKARYPRHARNHRSDTAIAPEESREHDKDRKEKPERSSTSSQSSIRALGSSNSSKDSLLSNARKLKLEQKIRIVETKMPELSAFQTVMKYYTRTVDYKTYELANRFSKYDDTVTSYNDQLVKKTKSQMKVHFFNPKDPISIIGYLALFKFFCCTNHIHEGVAMWVLSDYDEETLANLLSRATLKEDRLSSFDTSPCNKVTRSGRL